jgi:DNA-binding SARP family transcriptional activator
MVTLRALGAAEIQTGAAKLTPSQEIIFAAGLFLLLQPGNRASRDRLARLLWPEIKDKPRDHRLRQTVLQLKKNGFALEADRTTLRLPTGTVQCDLTKLAGGDLANFVQLDSLEFLPGYNPRFSEPFRDWVDTKRDEVHASATRLLLRAVEEKRLQGDWSTVERIAGKCLVLEPLNETAVLAKAEACAMRGGKLKAVSMLDGYIAEVGNLHDLKLPASVLRRRVVERVAECGQLLTSDPPFVGREPEMEKLTSGLERARFGKGSSILLVGDPGIGKSRLCAELAQFAELQGAHVQRTRCRRTDLDRPLSLFVDVVPHMRELPGALGCAPETFTWLKRLTEFEQQIGHSARLGDAEIPFQNVREALFDLFDSVAEERRLVLVVEDVQWLDSASAKILAQMVEWCETKRVFLLINSRPNTNPFLNQTEKGRIGIIALGGLPNTASASLLRSIVPQSASPLKTDFVDWCLRVADGNPFFLQELVRQWFETGRRYEAPPSVSKLLQERVARLSKEALQVLQTSAILGDCASIERVQHVLGYAPHQILSAIEELSSSAMLASSDVLSLQNGRLQPRHDFLSSAAIGALAPASLAFLHRRAADVLEEETSKNAVSTTLLWACATHRNRAGDRQRALSLGIACAQHLLELGLTAEACTRFEDSLAYCNSNEDRLSLLPHYSMALQLNGQWGRSKEILETCIALSSPGATITSHNQFEILLFQARHRSNLDFVTLLGDITPCVESIEAPPAHRVAAAVIALKVASDVGPAAKLDAIYARVQPFLKSEDIDFVSRFEVELIYQTMRGDKEIPLEDMERFVETARLSYGELGYSQALVAVASACRIGGRDRECLAFLDSALQHAEAQKLRTRIPTIILAQIRLHVLADNFVAARERITRGRDHVIPDDDQVTRPEWQYYEARVALEDSPLAEAEAAANAIKIVPVTNAVSRRGGCCAVMLCLRLRQGAEVETLRSLVTELAAAHLITRDIGCQDFEAHSLFLGRCALGERRNAQRLLDDYVHRFRHSRRPLSASIRALYPENR